MPNPLDYAVGWICAVTTEYVAAQALLDEKHAGPDNIPLHDHNDYTLGRVGRHNVVIAVLPLGEYGISSATGVAKDMLNSFPNIRIGLLVGIGGGAPSSRHDIRLGDVVVGISNNGKGSVVQYDYGKAVQGQEFHVTGYLNQPPTFLRTAVSGLKAQYEAEGHQLKEAIRQACQSRPKLQKKYQRPDRATDRLYRSEVLHKYDGRDCAQVCSSNASNLVQRGKRTEDDDDPAIHYGQIASANTLMKDTAARDAIMQKWNILCFEMEAAGLMNHFPCVVIRGICDYSDSHKSKEWQGYAAMTAAAYAKDLLCRIPPKRITQEKKITEVLSDIRENVRSLVQRTFDNERKSILHWLTPVDYAPVQNDIFNRREPGTSQWVVEKPEFQTWLLSRGQTLFCPGMPGAGKTFHVSTVVHNLQARCEDDPSAGYAFIYCNFRRKDQTLRDLLASLVRQFAQGQSLFPEAVKLLHDKHKRSRTVPTTSELLQTLGSLLSLYSRAFIVVDALDECQTEDGCQKRLVLELFKLCNSRAVNLFLTSRISSSIAEMFHNCVQLEIRATEEDVRRYLKAQLFQLQEFVQRNGELQSQIILSITEAVDGMFLLAKLHLDAIKVKTTPKYLCITLAKLHTGSEAYDFAYQDAMTRITGQVADHADLAVKALSWIVHAERPLTTTELRTALATEVGASEPDDSNMSDITDIIAVCAGLVTIDEESQIVRLVHYTAQEYFERTKLEWFGDTESAIASVCATYLCFDIFDTGPCDDDLSFKKRLQQYPLYSYSSSNWGRHARRVPTCNAVMKFLNEPSKVEASFQAWNEQKFSWSEPWVVTGVTEIHFAACFGATEYVKWLCHSVNPNSADSAHRTPLSYAAELGHADVVSTLLDKGVKIDPTNATRLLTRAVKNGHSSVVELLVGKGGCNADRLDGFLVSPLIHAVAQNNTAIVRLLLDHGANPNLATNTCPTTPLEEAAKVGNETIVRLLLEHGALVDRVDDTEATALFHAAERGHEEVVRLLLKHGAQVNLMDRYGAGPVKGAAIFGHKAIVQLLLEHGAKEESRYGDGDDLLFQVHQNALLRKAPSHSSSGHIRDFDYKAQRA